MHCKIFLNSVNQMGTRDHLQQRLTFFNDSRAKSLFLQRKLDKFYQNQFAILFILFISVHLLIQFSSLYIHENLCISDSGRASDLDESILTAHIPVLARNALKYLCLVKKYDVADYLIVISIDPFSNVADKSGGPNVLPLPSCFLFLLRLYFHRLFSSLELRIPPRPRSPPVR